jgi:hypothetical protein
VVTLAGVCADSCVKSNKQANENNPFFIFLKI